MHALTFMSIQSWHMQICQLPNTSWNSRGQMCSVHVVLVRSMVSKGMDCQSTMFWSTSQGPLVPKHSNGIPITCRCIHKSGMMPCWKTLHPKQPNVLVTIYVSTMGYRTSVQYVSFHL